MRRRLIELCVVLIEQVPGLRPDAIIGHDEVPGKSTDCPGRIDVRALRAAVAAELAARMPR
ncbi:MAG: hypothetical protein H0W72_10835 [Planctomycetes bacterium]|nr:hypothetical protein [Planctomycetota bacterium]